jgi:hypothetical protein
MSNGDSAPSDPDPELLASSSLSYDDSERGGTKEQGCTT